MCDAKQKSLAPTSLHEKFCQATAGIPCKTAHAVTRFLARLVGRTPPTSGCGCGCEGDHPAKGESPSEGCGCKGHH